MRPLRPIELIYQTVNRFRRALYRRGTLSATRLPRTVISIGNLSIGGSGKTPLTIAVARHLVRRGSRVAILSRGHGRRNVREMAVVDSVDAGRFGDEPVLIHRSVNDVDVVVGADRARAGQWYLERHDCDLFLLDDGFQHLRLDRDIDIVIDDPEAAYAREGRSALLDADLVVIRGGRTTREPAVHRMELQPSCLIVPGGEVPLDVLKAKRVFAFSAIANNQRFIDSLATIGATIVGRREFADHHRYSSADVDLIHAEASRAGAERVVTTEKDLVKIPGSGFDALRVETSISPGFYAELEKLLERCR